MIGLQIRKTITALSFLAFVASLCLWVRSYWAFDVIGRAWVSSDKLHPGFVQIESKNGAVSVERWVTDYSLTERARKAATRKALEPGFYYLGGNPDAPSVSDLGFHSYFRQPITDFHTASRIGIGHWVFVLVFSVLPAMWLRGFLRRRHRLREGLCPM